MKGTIIIDLDGTLCDCRHRIEYARTGQWDEFHSRLKDDPIFHDVLWFIRLLSYDHSIVGITGRNQRYSGLTYEWLRKHKADEYVDHIYFRGDKDFSPDTEMKIKAIETVFGSKEAALEQIRVVLEDRDKVVEAYRNYGLPCWQVRTGGY